MAFRFLNRFETANNGHSDSFCEGMLHNLLDPYLTEASVETSLSYQF